MVWPAHGLCTHSASIFEGLLLTIEFLMIWFSPPPRHNQDIVSVWRNLSMIIWDIINNTLQCYRVSNMRIMPDNTSSLIVEDCLCGDGYLGTSCEVSSLYADIICHVLDCKHFHTSDKKQSAWKDQNSNQIHIGTLSIKTQRRIHWKWSNWHEVP